MRFLKLPLAFIAGTILIGPVSPAPAPQEGYSNPDRRYRPMNSRHVHPRWLNPTLIDGFLYPTTQMPPANGHRVQSNPPLWDYAEPLHTSNVVSRSSFGNTMGSNTVDPATGLTGASFTRPEPYALAMDVDSRGVVHIAGAAPDSALMTSPSSIYYYTSRYDLRRANGFSAPELITSDFMGIPSIAASRVDDGVYIVYINGDDDVVCRYKDPQTGIFSNETVLAAGGGGLVYERPLAKVNASGSLVVVCRRFESLPSGTWTDSVVRINGTGGGGPQNIPGSLYGSGVRNGWIADWRMAMSGDGLSVVWQYREPDYEYDFNNDEITDVYERRGGIQASILGGGATDISNNSNPRIRAWQEVPDIAHAPDGSAHFVWVQARVPATVPPVDPRDLPMVPPSVHYTRVGGSGSGMTELYSEVAGTLPTIVIANELDSMSTGIFGLPKHLGPRVVCDLRGRPHVFTGTDARRVGTDWMGRRVRHATWIPATAETPSMWYFFAQLPIDVVSAYYPNSMDDVPFGTDFGDQVEVIVDVNGQIHMTDAAHYTRTIDPELGIRDPNSMHGVFPGASVNVTNGNLHFELPLFGTKGTGLNQEMRLIYNSKEYGSAHFAQGWKLNYEMHIIDHWRAINVAWRAPDALTLVLPDGRYVNFRYTDFGTSGMPNYLVAGNNFDPTSSFMAKIERTPSMVSSITRLSTWNVQYTMTVKNGTKYFFDQYGKLTAIEDPGENTITLTYQDGRLSSVTDKESRTTTFDYESSGNLNRMVRVDQITDPAGRDYNLTYDDGPEETDPVRHLKEVAFAGVSPSPTWSFEYGMMSGSNDRLYILKKACPPRGTASDDYGWDVHYSEDGRVLAIEDPPDGGRALDPNPNDPISSGTPCVQFYYNDLLLGAGGADVDYETVVTNRRGQMTRYRSDPRRSIIYEIWDADYLGAWWPMPTEWDPSLPAGMSQRIFEYTYQSQLVSTTDRWGIRTVYENETAEDAPHVIDLIGSVRKDPGTGILRLIAQYTYTNDGLHQVATVSSPQVTTGLWNGVGSEARTTSYLYYGSTEGNGQWGQLKQVTYPNCTNPDGSISSIHQVRYEYRDSDGALVKVTDEEGRETTYSNFHSVHGLPRSKVPAGCSQAENFEYDLMGYLTDHRLPQGGSGNSAPGWTEYEYDGLYRLVEVKLPAVGGENPNAGTINSSRTTVNEYDLDGNLVSMTPPAGGPTTTTYNKMGQVTGGSGPVGQWSQTVDANGNVRTVTDIRGYDSVRVYDGLDRVIESRSPGASSGGAGGGTEMVVVTLYDQYSGWHFTSEIRGGPQLSYESWGGTVRTVNTRFDEFGRPYRVYGPNQYQMVETFYNEIDEPWAVAVYGPEAVSGGATSVFQRIQYSYRDQRGKIIATRVTGRAMGGTMSTSDADTNTTTYDRSGRVVAVTDNSGATTSYDLDEAGRVQHVVDATNVIVEERVYGDDGLLIETRVPNPETKSASRVTARKIAYTSRKEIWKDWNAADKGTTTQYSYLPGQVDTVTDANGVVTKTTYYETTQKVDEVVQAFGTTAARTTKTVWSEGLPTETRVFNPSNGTISAAYTKVFDQAGRLQISDEPERDARTLTYNSWGELIGDDQGGLTITHVRNDRGLADSSEHVQGTVTSYVTRMFNGSGVQTSINANGLTVWSSLAQPGWGTSGNAAWRGVPYRENFMLGETTWKRQSFEYDERGMASAMADAEVEVGSEGTQPSNHSWTRDDNGRVTELRFDDTLVMSMEYTPGGLLDRRRHYDESGNEIARTIVKYDVLGRKVSEQTFRTSSNLVLSHVVLEYDDADRITAKELRHLGVRQEFEYNDLGELTRDSSDGNSNWATSSPAGLHGADFTNQIGNPGTGNESDPSDEAEIESASGSQLVSAMSVDDWDRHYIYDGAGNRASMTIDGVTTTNTYNAGSQLTQSVTGGVTVTYGYNGLGNQTARTTTQSGQSTIYEEYQYDYLNRMSSYANSVTGATWTYQHWPTGDRFEKRNVESEVAELSVPRWGDTSVEYSQEGTAAAEFENRYVQAPGIDSKAVRISESGVRRHYVGDQVGSILMTLTDGGAREEQCVRDAYGQTIAGNTNDERYGYAQREHDTESGLVYMRHRMYDPRIGRFTQMDPVIGLRPTEHYVYARNNPAAGTDPMGTIVKFTKGTNPTMQAAMLSSFSKFLGATVSMDRDGQIHISGPYMNGDRASIISGLNRMIADQKVHSFEQFVGAYSNSSDDLMAAMEDFAAEVQSTGNAATSVALAVADWLPGAGVHEAFSGADIDGNTIGFGAMMFALATDIPIVGKGLKAAKRGSKAIKYVGRAGSHLDEAAEVGRGAKRKIDRIKEHLSPDDIRGAIKDIQGNPIINRGTGAPYQHLKEVQDAQAGLVNEIERIKRALSTNSISNEVRSALTRELSESSRLLDATEDALRKAR